MKILYGIIAYCVEVLKWCWIAENKFYVLYCILHCYITYIWYIPCSTSRLLYHLIYGAHCLHEYGNIQKTWILNYLGNSSLSEVTNYCITFLIATFFLVKVTLKTKIMNSFKSNRELSVYNVNLTPYIRYIICSILFENKLKIKINLHIFI